MVNFGISPKNVHIEDLRLLLKAIGYEQIKKKPGRKISVRATAVKIICLLYFIDIVSWYLS